MPTFLGGVPIKFPRRTALVRTVLAPDFPIVLRYKPPHKPFPVCCPIQFTQGPDHAGSVMELTKCKPCSKVVFDHHRGNRTVPLHDLPQISFFETMICDACDAYGIIGGGSTVFCRRMPKRAVPLVTLGSKAAGNHWWEGTERPPTRRLAPARR